MSSSRSPSGRQSLTAGGVCLRVQNRLQAWPTLLEEGWRVNPRLGQDSRTQEPVPPLLPSSQPFPTEQQSETAVAVNTVSLCLIPSAVRMCLRIDLLRVDTRCRFLLNLFLEDTLFSPLLPETLSGCSGCTSLAGLRLQYVRLPCGVGEPGSGHINVLSSCAPDLACWGAGRGAGRGRGQCGS